MSAFLNMGFTAAPRVSRRVELSAVPADEDWLCLIVMKQHRIPISTQGDSGEIESEELSIDIQKARIRLPGIGVGWTLVAPPSCIKDPCGTLQLAIGKSVWLVTVDWYGTATDIPTWMIQIFEWILIRNFRKVIGFHSIFPRGQKNGLFPARHVLFNVEVDE